MKEFIIPTAKFMAYFHGEEWYTCPTCRNGIEAYDCVYEHAGIKKVKDEKNVYICPECHNKFRLPD